MQTVPGSNRGESLQMQAFNFAVSVLRATCQVLGLGFDQKAEVSRTWRLSSVRPLHWPTTISWPVVASSLGP